MITFRLCTVLLVLDCLAPLSLFAQDHLVVFGGYSYLRPPVTVNESWVCPGSPCPAILSLPRAVTNHKSLNGWEFSASYRFLPFLGVAADFSGNYGSALARSNSNAHQYTYLFGPKVSLPKRVSPFAHVLFGGTRQAISAGTFSGYPQLYNTIAWARDSGFASVLGGGVDLKVIPHVWIRPIQIDYMLTRLNGSTQNQPRISAGLVLHL